MEAMPRINSRDRCLQCRMRTALCVCGLAPRLELGTRVVILMHAFEIKTTTNTARLACLSLKNSEIRVRGNADSPLETQDLVAGAHQPLLLYPTPEARELTPDYVAELKAQNGGLPITLIVPDGNWRQASKVARREPAFAEIPRIKLMPGPPSKYQLRQEHNIEWVCTFEAIARALGVLEGADAQKKLESVFDVMVERTLWSRGKIATEDCVHPIPHDAIHGELRVRG